jgi:hypothetical protein
MSLFFTKNPISRYCMRNRLFKCKTCNKLKELKSGFTKTQQKKIKKNIRKCSVICKDCVIIYIDNIESKCNLCNKVFSSRNKLHKHLRKNKDIKCSETLVLKQLASYIVENNNNFIPLTNINKIFPTEIEFIICSYTNEEPILKNLYDPYSIFNTRKFIILSKKYYQYKLDYICRELYEEYDDNNFKNIFSYKFNKKKIHFVKHYQFLREKTLIILERLNIELYQLHINY